MTDKEKEVQDMLSFLKGEKIQESSEVTGAVEETSTPEPTVDNDKEESDEKEELQQEEQEQGSSESTGDDEDVKSKEKEKVDKDSKEEEKKEDKPEEINYSELFKSTEKTEQDDKSDSKEEVDDDSWKKYFRSKEEYEKFLLKRELEDRNMMSLDELDSLSGKELVLKQMLDKQSRWGMTREVALNKLAEKYGVEREELEPPENAYLFADDAEAAYNNYKSAIDSVYESVSSKTTTVKEDSKKQEDLQKQSEQARAEAIRQENLRKWSEVSKIVAKDPNATKIKEKIGESDFEYLMEESFIEEMPQAIVKIAEQNNLEPTEENLRMVVSEIHDFYFKVNRQKIIRAAQDEAIKRLEDTNSRELDNPRVNKDEAQGSKGNKNSAQEFISWHRAG